MKLTPYEYLAAQALSDLVVDGDTDAENVEIGLMHKGSRYPIELRACVEMERPLRTRWVARMVALSMSQRSM